MNARKRIMILSIAILGLIIITMAAATALQQSAPTPIPSAEISCPTPDETSIPICAPGEAATATPGEEPFLLGTPAGP